MKLISIVGARPNFMKIAPIMEAVGEHNRVSGKPIKNVLVHTGQHYDEKMSRLFFEELGIPRPDVDLGVGSGSHAEQTAEVMKRFEKVCLSENPTHILVVGDVNSTIACALVAAKMGIKVIHVEAGLRSFDRTMPEEINRVLTDSISDYLFTTEKSAEENLAREGIGQEKIFFVGNVMIDTLLKHRDKAMASSLFECAGMRDSSDRVPGYGVLTLHRPSNVDDPAALGEILGALIEISKELPVIFPVHPRTRKKIEEFGLAKSFTELSSGLGSSGIHTTEPLGYLDFLALLSSAKMVLTDSGGIQEETTVLGVPCVTIRENTERPVTITHGTNVLAGTTKDGILKAARSSFERKSAQEKMAPPLWDGDAAKRIVAVLAGL